MAFLDLAVAVLQKVCAVAMQDAGEPAVSEAQCSSPLSPLPPASTPNDAHRLVIEERMKQADGI